MLTTHIHRHASAPAATTAPASTWPSRRELFGWFAAGAALFFLVPWLGTDVLGLQPDLYYVMYFTVALAFLGGFAHRYGGDLQRLWREHLPATLVVGAVAAVAGLVQVLGQESTPHAEGWRFPFEIVWRGLVYGVVDASVLFVFPAAVVFLLMRGDRSGVRRRLAFAGVTLLLSMLVTATYHLGYQEFRGSELRYPEIGAVLANVPTAVTGNPVGAVVVHATMHVSTTVDHRDGGEQQMLPPHVSDSYPGRGNEDVAAALAIGWLVLVSGAGVIVGRRRR